MRAYETSKEFSNKVVVAPCSGVGRTVGTISRQAAYAVVDEFMPDETMLLCLPAYVVNVEEDVKMVEENPDRIVVIDGCGNKCMSKILEGRGFKPAKTIIVSAIIKDMSLKIDKLKSRAKLGDCEDKVVSEVARVVVEAVKELKG